MLGQILVQRGLITTEQLRQAIRLQLEEEMWDLFGISDGSFKFEHGDEASVGDVLIELDIDPLLLEGTRRMDEWARIVKNIPDEEAIPGVVPFQDPADRELMTFSDNEWRVISLINGASSIKSIAGRSGIGRFETFRIMNSFLAAGHIALSTAEQLQAVSAEDTGEMHVHGGNGNGSHKALFPENTSQPRRPAPERKKATAGKFVSPVAFLAAAADSILAELRNTSDFYMGPADDKFAEVQWRKVINEYPKADLVRALGNTMSTERFDDYVSIVGIEGEFRPCYEETFEALSRYLRNLYLAAAQRLGTKAAQNIFNRTFTELKGRSEIQNGEQFHLKDYASKVTA